MREFIYLEMIKHQKIRLKIKVVDKNGKTPLIGTRIEVVQKNLKQIREIEGGKGTTNQHSLVQYFGFPADENVSVIVSFLRWHRTKAERSED